MNKRANKRLLIVFAAAVETMSLSAIGADNDIRLQSVDKLMADGDAAYKTGDWVHAAGDYQSVVGLKNDDAEAMLKLGDCYYRMTGDDDDNLARARGAWNSVLATDPHNLAARQRLLDSWQDQVRLDNSPGTLDATRDAANAMLEIDPNNTKAQFVLVSETLRRWIATPNLVDDAQVRSMMKTLDAMYAKDPANADLLNYSCTAQLVYAKFLGESDAKMTTDLRAQATARLEQALKDRPTDGEMHWAAYQVYMQMLRTDALEKVDADAKIAEQIKLAQQFARSSDADFISINLSLVSWYHFHKEPNHADALISQLAKDHPDSPTIREGISELLDPDKAIAVLSQPMPPLTSQGFKAVLDKSIECHLMYRLVILRLNQADRQSDPAKRKQIMDQVDKDFGQLQASTSTMKLKADYISHIRARLLVEKGDFVGAIQAYDTLLTKIKGATMPEAPRIALEQVKFYEQTQQYGPAMNLLLSVTQYNPDNVDLNAELAALQMDNDLLPECAATLDRLGKLAPDDPRVINLNIRLRVKTGHLADARAIYDKLPEKNLQDLAAKFAVAQSILGDPDETVRLAKLIHSDSKEANNLQIVYVLAQAEIDDSKLPEARELIDDALSKFPNDTALILMKIELSDESDAKKFDQKKLVLEQQTDLYTRYMQLAALERQSGGNLADAAGYLQQALGLPKHSDDRNATSQLYQVDLQLHRYDEAQPLMERMAAEAVPPSGDLLRDHFAIEQGDYGKAIALAQGVINKFPQFNVGYLAMGDALRLAGRYNDAIDQYKFALGKQIDAEAENGLISCYEALKDADKESDTLDEAVRRFPENIAFRERRLDYLASHGHADEVLQQRMALRDKNPQDPAAWLSVARTYELLARSNASDANLVKQDGQKAVDVLTQAIGKFPDDQRFYAEALPILHELKQDDAAEGLLDRMGQRAKFKDTPLINELLFQQFVREGKNDRAESMLEQEYQNSGHALSLELRLAAYLTDEKKYDQALKVLEDHADDLHVVLQRFQTLEASGQMDKAELLLEDKIKQQPNSTMLLAGLVDYYMSTRQFPQALYRLNALLAQTPDNESALLTRAVVYSSKQPPDLAAANADLAAARKLDPYDSRVVLQIANLKIAGGDVKGAHDALSDALKTNPQQSEVRRNLVQIDASMNPPDWAEVISLVKAAEKLPNLSADPQWYAVHAQALLALHETRDAIAAIKQAIQLDTDPKHLTYEIPYLDILLGDSASSDNYQEALNETNRLLDTGMKEWWLYLYRGIAKARTQDMSGALEDMDKALDVAGKDDARCMDVLRAMAKYVNPAEAISRIGKHDDPTGQWAVLALKISQDSKNQRMIGDALNQLMVVQANPKMAPGPRDAILVEAGQAYETLGKHDQAKQAYLKALEINPKNVLVLNNLAYLMADSMGQAPQARPYAQKAYDLQNDANGKVEPGVLDTYGWVLVLCGGDDASRGIDMLKQAIQENDHLIEAECHLGEAYMRQSKYSQARHELLRAKDLVDENNREQRPVSKDLSDRVNRQLELVDNDIKAGGQ